MTPDTIIDGILRAEGSAYTNDPADSGAIGLSRESICWARIP